MLLALVLLLAIPALDISWSLVDDATHSIERPRLMLDALHEGHWIGSLNSGQPGVIVTEFADGRFRPVGWLYFMTTYALLGENPVYHHAFRFVLLAVTVSATFLVGLWLSGSNTVGFLSGLFLILYTPALEGYYRLSPWEIPLTMLLASGLAAMAFMFRRVYAGRQSTLALAIGFGVAFFALILALGAKESSVAFAPVLVALPVGALLTARSPERKRWLRWITPLAVILLIVYAAYLLVILANHATEQGYGSNYGSGGIAIFLRNLVAYCWAILRNYNLFLLIGLASFASRLRTHWQTRQPLSATDYWQLVLLLMTAVGVIFQSPFRAIIERYLLPYVLGLAIFLGLEARHIILYLNQWHGLRRRGLVVVLVMGGVFLLWETVPTGLINYEWVRQRENSSYQTMQYIAAHAEPGARIWTNLSRSGDYAELISGIGRVQRIFFERDDLAILSLSDDSSPGCCEAGDWIILWDHGAALAPEQAVGELGNSIRLEQEYDYTAYRLFSPATLIESILLNGPMHLPERAPKSSYSYTWYIYHLPSGDSSEAAS
ncbi:MAG: hypothetical protein IT320_02385 [Anaerolineae bacterium]|nr:hypothetical protein [Anaerolineae bacterium]